MTKQETIELAREFASDTFHTVANIARKSREARHILRGRWDDIDGLRRATESGVDVLLFNEAASKRWRMLSREWMRDDDEWAMQDGLTEK